MEVIKLLVFSHDDWKYSIVVSFDRPISRMSVENWIQNHELKELFVYSNTSKSWDTANETLNKDACET